MKLFHLADLHLGKTLHQYNLIEDQRHALQQVLDLVRQEQPQAVLLAGDLYDRLIPSAEAVALLDWFLTRLAELDLAVLAVPGNHDSAARLSYGAGIFASRGIHLAGPFCGRLEFVDITAAGQRLRIHLLPFVKPVLVRACFPEDDVANQTDAVRLALSTARLDPAVPNVLLCHQFVAGSGDLPHLSESEDLIAGNLEPVHTSVFHAFDYVALGHLHRAQQVGSDRIRYAGSLLKYSASEADQEKSVTMLSFDAAGELTVRLHSLEPLRDLRRITGPLQELLQIGRTDPRAGRDFFQVNLTDEVMQIDAYDQLRTVYANLLGVSQEAAAPIGPDQGLPELAALDALNPLELFQQFFTVQTGKDLTDRQLQISERLLFAPGEDAV